MPLDKLDQEFGASLESLAALKQEVVRAPQSPTSRILDKVASKINKKEHHTRIKIAADLATNGLDPRKAVDVVATISNIADKNSSGLQTSLYKVAERLITSSEIATQLSGYKLKEACKLAGLDSSHRIPISAAASLVEIAKEVFDAKSLSKVAGIKPKVLASGTIKFKSAEQANKFEKNLRLAIKKLRKKYKR